MGLYDGMDIVPAGAAPPAPPFPKSPIAGLYDGLEVVPNAAQTVPQPREAKGFVESVQAGFQASAPGLAWRRKLPELISNPEHASWWERAATGITQVVSELPLMIGGAIAGAPVGSAAGGAMAGPPGAAAGAVLGAGFGMGAVPAAIRTSYVEALKAGEVKDAGDFWNILREAAIAAAKEGGINAAAMGAGALAGRAVGAAIAPGIGTKMAVGTAIKAIETADIATQIALMPTIPAVLAGRLPAAHEFLDAAIVIGGLKAAHVTAARITQVYQRTGKTPAEQVADAQENPEVAREMAAEPEARAAVEVPRTPDGRVDMPTIQEALFAETARVDELELRARNAATPLSDAERVELEGLKSRVASLEEQLSAAAIAATRPVDAAPRFAPEQLVDARTQAEARILELDAKAADGALTDTERAQRVFLKNSLDKPEALAMHFKLEPAGGRVPTAEEREASAQRVYEDVLAQVRAADEARRGAGLEPLGEAHADAVAKLVRARVRTRAARMGKLPEEIYNERPLQIRDEAAADTIPAQGETKGPLGETTAEAPQGPEVDLFGEPIVPPAVDHAVAELPITQVPVAGLRLSMDVPQFKGGADANGVVVPLQGKFDPTGVGPIQVWERLNGDLEVISGRHRFDLARRDGRELINAQVHREADGFTADQAAALDAILNIRDEQGSTADYAQFFKLAGITKEAADAQGLLARAKGKAGFAIARDASGDLLAAHRAGKLSDEAALAISAAAPGSDRLQALGIMQVTEGKSILFAVNTMRAVDLMAAERMAAGAQGDIFGFDDSAMREAAAMAKKASSKQRAISEQIAAVSGASRRPELARKMGVDVQDPEGIQKKIAELKQEQYLWDNWPLYPELVAKLRALDQEPLPNEKRGLWYTDATPEQQRKLNDWEDSRGLSEFEDLVLRRTDEDIYESADAHFTDHEVAKGLHSIPIADLGELTGYDNAKDKARIQRLADAIKENGEIAPVFVGLDPSGEAYVMEGQHRTRALALLGYKNVPAKVVVDMEPPAKPSEPVVMMRAETPAEARARDAEAAAAAMRKIENDGEPPPDTLFQSRPDTWWYSALARQVDTANMKAAPAQGWKDWLKGQAGKGAIKADEIKWSGLEEWLDLQEGRVTKEAVAAYLKTGGVKVDEVMLGKEGEPNFGDARIAGDLETLRRAGWDVETPPDVDDFAYVAFRDPHGNIEDAADLRRWAAEDPSLQPIAEAANRIFDHIQSGPKDAPPTKFSQYVLPGGKNYRELLLTLPEKPGQLPIYHIVRDQELMPALVAIGMPRAENALRRQAVYELAGRQLEWADDADASEAALAAEKLQSAGYGEVLKRYRDTFRYADAPRGPRAQTFESSHFDTPNILAHVRFNERTDAEGKRVLFVEEFQSDWAQKGRKEGFTEPPKEPPSIAELKQQYAAKVSPAPDEITRYQIQDENGDPIRGQTSVFMTPDGAKESVPAERWRQLEHAGYVVKEITEPAPAPWMVTWRDGSQGFYSTEMSAHNALMMEWRKDNPAPEGRIPTAPFVGKTEAWLQLAVKRMVAYAAENGFDKIAWTRGEQQVERYTSALRKAVDVIEWKKTPDGIHLVGYKGGVGRDRVLREAQQLLSDVDTLLAGRNIQDLQPNERSRVYELQQQYQALQAQRNRTKVVDTTEKENALSDAIGKAMAEQIIKDPNQEGTIEGEGIKVDDTGMAGFYDRILPGVAKDVIKKLGGGKVGETRIVGPLTRVDTLEYPMVRPSPDATEWLVSSDGEAKTFPTEAEARAYAATLPKTTVKVGGEKQPAFDITPEMREKAMQGLPLFQDPNTPRGSYQIAANLITTMQGADKSTVVHELGHSWLEEMKADAAREDAPAQIKADWDILRAELAIGADGKISRESHEQWARTVERYLAEGEAPSVELRGVFERFKAWLLEIYQSLGALKANVTPELKGVLDRMLATDEQIAAARELDVPTSYVPEAAAARAEAIVPPPVPKREIRPGLVAEATAIKPFADELPAGPGEAPDTSRVNYAYINTPTDVKLAMQRMSELDQAEIQKQRGGTDGVKSWAEANAEQARYLNDILGGSPDTLKLFEPRDPDAPHVDVRLGILKKLAVGAAKDSARLRDIVLEKGHDATVREQLEYLGSIERARMIQAEFLGERASVARALNALKDSTEGTGEIGRMLEAIGLGDDATLMQAARTAAEEQAYLKAQLDQILLNYKGKSVLDIAKLHKEIGTLKGSFKLAKELEKASTWEMVVEAWKSALLSGPVTHTTNLFGTGAFHVMRAPVDALAAVIGMARGASPGMGESDRASMSEAVARLTGMLGGVQDGLKVAYHTFQMDDPTGKTESYRGAIPGRAGEIIRIPLRLMGAEDALVSTMYKRGELRTLAIRQAFDEQLNPSTREFAERVAHLVDNPTPEMDAIATDAGTRMTFNMPLGEKGIALQLFVNKWNLQWMLPFIRTPINIFKELIRMSPFAPAIGEWRADIAKGGVARDRALAEIAIGAGVMTATMALAFSGQISGNGSPDPGKNRAKVGVWQPYSVLIGDTWYEYARIQPTGTLMGMAADMSLIWDHMTDEEKDKTPKLIAAAFANAVTNQTFLQGITNVVNATSDPVRFGPRFLQQFAGSLVPNVIGQPTAMADPVVREVNGMLEAIQSRIPGMRQDLLPKRDWLGDPVKTKERLGLIMPVREQKVSEDKVRLEADRLELSMAAAPKKTHIGKGTGKLGDVELTPQERDTFASVGGEFAHKILTNIVNAPGYDEMPDLVKRQIFAKVLTASHRVAAVAAMPPEKRMAYLESITEKVQSELQPAGQE